jgi:hypothetical protein
VNILQVQSCDNLADLFIKSLPATVLVWDNLETCGIRGEIAPEYLPLFLGLEDPKFYNPNDWKVSWRYLLHFFFHKQVF